jgi:hypothetical protein
MQSWARGNMYNIFFIHTIQSNAVVLMIDFLKQLTKKWFSKHFYSMAEVGHQVTALP